MSDIPALAEEFRQAYAAGEHPDAAAFLARVPEDQRDELGRLIRAVLADEPPPDPAPETLLMVQAMRRGEPPLLELRTARGMTRDQVVSDLREELGLEPADEQRVAVYYHELETGQLPLAGIRDRVFEAVATVMGVARSSLLLQGPQGGGAGAPQAVYARAEPGTEVNLDALAALPGEPGAVDDLFTGGPG
ncbi:MAG: hypothetical protein FJW99_09330 [Actinobacteria bacterium]|nr:hypothetical protein [Actinomycetota bacterium]MBM3698030.1 hypothetical protein [Actinomycetota bacterium]